MICVWLVDYYKQTNFKKVNCDCDNIFKNNNRANCKDQEFCFKCKRFHKNILESLKKINNEL